MPERQVPGVYVEEVSSGARPIAGVPTSIAGFVGPARFGPAAAATLLTSLTEFEHHYGGGAPLAFGGGDVAENCLWHAARAFFAEGGRQLYAARVFRPLSADDDGRARGAVMARRAAAVTLAARHPGRAGNGLVNIMFALGPDSLVRTADGSTALAGVTERDVVLVSGARAGFCLVLRGRGRGSSWRLKPTRGPAQALADVAAGDPGVRIRRLSVSVQFAAADADAAPVTLAGLALDPACLAAPGSLFAPQSDDLPISITAPPRSNGLTILALLRRLHAAQHGGQADAFLRALQDDASPAAQRSVTVPVSGGNDGLAPTAATIAGDADAPGAAAGLAALTAVDEIAIVAAPGATRSDNDDARAAIAALIRHAESLRHRIAIIDSVRGQSIADVRALRARYDSSHAAFYYPWVRTSDPATGAESVQPPSGFVAGIYARTDSERGVWKAPANEIVRLARGFEVLINQGQQELLNPEGINCFRDLAGRGLRLWGARTMSRDPEWTYVNVRRYLSYLERAIDRGTQWAVFEPNGERLWATVRAAIGTFLQGEWQNGALMGTKAAEAFFVSCDRTSMTQADLDAGRLVCSIGVAVLRPAEFLIFRVSQQTADRSA